LLEKTSAKCGQLLDKTEETMKNRGLILKDAQLPPGANLLKRLTWLLTQMFFAFVFLLRSFPQSLKERCHAISDTCWCTIPSSLITYKDNAIQMIRSHLPKKSTPRKTPEQTQKSHETLNPNDQTTTSTEQGLKQSKETKNEDEQREGEGSRDISPVESQKSPTHVVKEESIPKGETSQEQSKLFSRSPNDPKQSQNISCEDSEQKDSRTVENENVPRDESISLESKEGTMKKELSTSEENKEGTTKKDLSASTAEANKEERKEESKEGTTKKDLSTSEENKETTENTKETTKKDFSTSEVNKEEQTEETEDQLTRNQKHAEGEEEDHQVVAEFTNDPKVMEGLSFVDVVKGNTEEIAAA